MYNIVFAAEHGSTDDERAETVNEYEYIGVVMERDKNSMCGCVRHREEKPEKTVHESRVVIAPLATTETTRPSSKNRARFSRERSYRNDFYRGGWGL